MSSVLVQCEVHHFRRGDPGGVRAKSSPELGLVCAVQLLHGILFPGGEALYHPAARMGASGGGQSGNSFFFKKKPH